LGCAGLSKISKDVVPLHLSICVQAPEFDARDRLLCHTLHSIAAATANSNDLCVRNSNSSVE
jgi:hypothetical protein